MPGFLDSLFSISNLCDAGLHCTFTPTNVQAFDPKSKVVKLQGWRDPTSRLWRFPICDILHNQLTLKKTHVIKSHQLTMHTTFPVHQLSLNVTMLLPDFQ